MNDQPHILVVDDDRRLRELIARYLGEKGYHVVTAVDAADARAKMKGLAFDLLVLDIMMPGEDGLELTAGLRGESDVPILLLTGRTEVEERIAGFEGRVQMGMRIRAERFCDLGWDLAMGATPETAYLTHVRLTQLRWTAGTMAPKTFRIRSVEPDLPQKEIKVLMRSFRIEADPVTGKDKVVAYCPNPFTGEAEREDVAGWRPPGGADCVPIPGGRGGR